MVRPSEEAFFYCRPFHPFPTADLGFTPFDGPAFRALATESVVAQQPPDMPRMVFHTCQFFDQDCNSRKRPQVGLVATADRTRDQSLDYLFGLIGGQLGFATGLSFAGKARFTPFDPCVLPPIGDLPTHSEPSTNFRGGYVLREEGSSPNSPLFHLSVVTLGWHDRIVHGDLGRCHPISRFSIRMGEVTFQLWLFWPSRRRTRTGLESAADKESGARTAVASARKETRVKKRMSFMGWRLRMRFETGDTLRLSCLANRL